MIFYNEIKFNLNFLNCVILDLRAEKTLLFFYI